MVIWCLFWTEQHRAVAGCLPTETVGSFCKQVETGESERRASNSRLTPLLTSTEAPGTKREAPGVFEKRHPSRRSHGQHRGPEDQAGIQRSSQKWRGVVTSLLLSPPPILKIKTRCSCFLQEMSDLHRQYVGAPQKYLRKRQVPSCCRSGL